MQKRIKYIINKNITYDDYKYYKEIISTYDNIDTITKYIELCNQDDRLPKQPELFFGRNGFFDWFDYLNIDTSNYYKHDEAIEIIKRYINNNYPKNKYILDKDHIIKTISQKYDKLPHYELWPSYFKYKNPTEFIDKITNTYFMDFI